MPTQPDQLLSQLLNKANILLAQPQQQQLLDYVALLHRWNKTYNLTSVRDASEMLSRHILDSLVIMPWLIGETFIDVGTGAGLPGIPLAIAMPHCQFTLLDSLGKRVRFLHQVKQQLALENVHLLQQRVESYQPPRPFNGVISRAFASLADMYQWCRHLTDQQGRFYALKGQLLSAEIDALTAEAQTEQVIKLQVPELQAERHLFIIRHATVRQ